MLLTDTQYAQAVLRQLSARPQVVLVSTFGIYGGILESGQDTASWGPNYNNSARQILDALKQVPTVKFLLGIASYRSCKGKLRCQDCEEKYCRQIIRILEHVEHWNMFDWRFSTSLHLKCQLMFKMLDGPVESSGVAGGRNLTGSTWDDVMFELTESQCLQLGQHWPIIWNKAEPLTKDSGQKLLDAMVIPCD